MGKRFPDDEIPFASNAPAPETIRKVLEEVTADLEHPPDYVNTIYMHGAIAALRWALGKGDSPITGRRAGVAPGPEELAEEADAAYEVIEGRSHRVDREWAIGAEHAMTWLYSGDNSTFVYAP